ncbi:hypothetical protein Fmac_001597 [Flemingia macrophylla]|uniref:Uncharacterized protein n=1 Tax=Flemingia macrophylla TaxID=520843 RepID=A0ABD1NIU5_9FABA
MAKPREGGSRSARKRAGARQISEIQFIPVVGGGLTGVFLLSGLTFAALNVVEQSASNISSSVANKDLGEHSSPPSKRGIKGTTKAKRARYIIKIPL